MDSGVHENINIIWIGYSAIFVPFEVMFVDLGGCLQMVSFELKIKFS